MKPKKLTDAEERELAAQVALRQSLSDKKLCARYGIARRTLWDIVRRQNAPRETAQDERIDITAQFAS